MAQVKNVAYKNEFIRDGLYGTGLIWPRPGYVHEVDDKIAAQMCSKHPDIWKDVTHGDEGQPDLAKAMDISPGLKSDKVNPVKVASIPKRVFSEDKMTAIQQAIDLLDPKNTEHYTTTGIPKVEAIQVLLGYDIDMKDRDDGFSLYNSSAAADSAPFPAPVTGG